MDTTQIIALGALLVAILGFVLNSRKETRSDASTMAQIQTKLDTAVSGITDVRVEIRGIRESLVDHSERIAKIEAKIEATDNRLNVLEGKQG